MKTKTKPKKRSKFRRLMKWAVVLVLLLVVGSVASVNVTSRSSFCNNCHIMETYYDSWAQGSHQDVACVECHIEPGTSNYVSAKLNGLGQVVDDLLNRTSTKPAASVSQFSCLRDGCHLIEDLKAPSNPDLPFLFDHEKHLNKMYKHVTIQCTTCHSHVKGSNHFEVNTNVCITCHLHEPPSSPNAQLVAFGSNDLPPEMERTVAVNDAHAGMTIAPTDCRSCHTAPTEPIMHQGLEVDHNEFVAFGADCQSCHRNVTAPAPLVTNQQCFGCHDFGLERMDDMSELHRVHTEGRHKVECFSCHGLIPHGPSAEILSLNQFDCQGCHSNQHDLQRTTYLSEPHGSNGEPLINPMFMAHVDCNGCHIKTRTLELRAGSAATVKVAVPEACDACHQPGFGKMMIDLWQSTTHRLYDETIALLPEPDAEWLAEDEQAQQAVEHARALLEQVREDGSWGVHNPKYTQKLISDARELMVNAGAVEKRDEEESP